MSTLRSSPEFKQEAVRQIVDRRLAVREGPLHKGVVPDIAGAFLVVSGADSGEVDHRFRPMLTAALVLTERRGGSAHYIGRAMSGRHPRPL